MGAEKGGDAALPPESRAGSRSGSPPSKKADTTDGVGGAALDAQSQSGGGARLAVPLIMQMTADEVSE
jgi:hypothetical protein